MVGCGKAESNDDNHANHAGENANQEVNEEVNEEITEEVAFTISKDNGEEIIAEEEIAVEEGAILLDVLQENFEVELTEQGFITAINGSEQDEEAGVYWMYDVNGEAALVGAGEYELQPGDEVVFDLRGM